MKNLRWLLHPQMVWGAVLCLVILAGWTEIRDAARHRGPGYVSYEQPDRTEKVSEDQYKRHHYGMGSMFIFLGLTCWVLVARSARDASSRSSGGVE